MLTVLLATRNGEETLPRVLDAYCQISMPNKEWKITIVNNGSTDHSERIIRSFMDTLPIEVLNEPRKGKNIALNTGLSKIDGELVVFTDDDVMPHADWLKNISLAADTQTDYTIFGGPIFPEWDLQPDQWILDWANLAAVFGIMDNIPEDGPIVHSSVYGGNMAVRSEVFKMGYRFEETIGPQGKNYAMGSETELLLRLGQDGFKAWYCKNATVKHIIRPVQVTEKWIMERAIRFGRGQYRLGRAYPERKWPILGMPTQCLLQLIKRGCCYLSALTRNDKEKIFKEGWLLNYYYGIALEGWSTYKNS
jgi:glycosyltransferase involved in cell wall biosynthesis